ncbi:hypothetical protein ACIBG7_03540 [Nonomuraea sp. NPDC050328]|uniref:hypothetical protein n=1 Tax=Nonomuraea sp. NPDC050328 TaxID=3364361 RepID=UPI0037B683FF
MTRQVTITLNVTASSRAEAERLAAPVLQRVAPHGEPAAEPYWKIAGTWMVDADLGLREGDSTSLVAETLGLLGVDAPVEGDADLAHGVWFDEQTPFPGIDWISVAAGHPASGEPQEVEELTPLLPDPPLSEEETETLMARLRGEDDGRR